MNKPAPNDVMAELLTLTMEVNQYGTRLYRNSEGQLHRVLGAAGISANGDEAWWLNGQRHRTDGPAVIWADGRQWWFLNGTHLTEKEFHERIRLQ